MAYQYRNPAQLFFSSLPSESQITVTESALKKLNKLEKSSADLYSYALTDTQASFCTKVGVPLSVHCFNVHPHPYSKTIENFLLFSNISNYLTNIKNFISIKESKYVKLTNPSRNSFHRLINRIIADRDKLRYSTELKIQNNKSLAQIGGIDESWFFHDELHHWSFEDMYDFLKESKPKRIIASIICPIEVFDSENSMNPSFYTFEVHKRHSKRRVSFSFYPDGSRESAYYQTSDSFWFRFNKISVGGEVYTISFLRSIKAHHLILVEKGNFETSPYYISDYSECISARLFGFTRYNSFMPIRFEVLKKELIYLLSLKRCDPNSAAAKLRQLSDEGYTGPELAFFLKLAGHIAKAKVFDDRTLFSCLYSNFCELFPERVDNALSSSYASRKLEKFILEAEPFYLRVRRTSNLEQEELNAVVFEDTQRFVITKLDEMFGSDEFRPGEADTSYSVDKSTLICTQADLNSIQGVLSYASTQRSVNQLPSDGVLPMELCFEELRFLQTRSMSFHGEFTYSKSKRAFQRERFGQLLLTNFSHKDEYPSEIREVEMKQVDPDEANTGVTKKESHFTEAVEADRRDENMFTCSGFESGDEARGMDEEDDEEPAVLSIGETSEEQEEGEDVEVKALTPGVNDFSVDYQDFVSINEILRSSIAVKHEGRVAVLDSRVDGLTYGFGDVLYRSAKFDQLDGLYKTLKEYGYNTCLVQEYKDGGHIGYHKDNESVYDPHIVTMINLKGRASFEIEGQPLFKLDGAQVLQFGSHSDRHRLLHASEGRISLTFRKQVRLMDGRQIKDSRSDRQDVIPENFGEIIDNLTNACFYDSLGEHLSLTRAQTISTLIALDGSWISKVINDSMVELSEVISTLTALDIPGSINSKGVRIDYLKEGAFKPIHLLMRDEHICIERTEAGTSLGEFTFKKMCERELTEVKAEYSAERARKLIKSFQEGATGKILNRFKVGFNKVTMKFARTFVSMGFAGSGKSRGIQQMILGPGNTKKTLVLSPRKNLIEDWKTKIIKGLNGKQMKVKLRTFEVGISALSRLAIKGEPLNVVVDEVTLMPGGYLDLCSCLAPEGSIIVVIGDPCQAGYYSRDDSGRNLGKAMDPLNNCEFPYLYRTHRFPKLFDIEGLQFLGKQELSELHMHEFGSPEAVLKKIEKPIFLCPSDAKRVELSHYGDAYTFGTSQGLTFDFVVISIDMDGPVTDNCHWMVALTRAKRGFAFLNCPTIRRCDFLRQSEGKLIHKILKKQKVSMDFIRFMGGKVMKKAQMLEAVGRTREEFEEACEGDPWMKAQLSFLEINIPEEPMVEEPIRKDSPPRTHLLHGCESTAQIQGPGMNKAREYREFKSKDTWSSQFQDDNPSRNLDNSAESFESIYPKHSNSDVLTMVAAIRKRLKFSDPSSERRRLERVKSVGISLFEIFCKEYGIKRRRFRDVEVIEQTFIEKRLNKSKKMIECHATRSDPDWSIKHFFLFMKSQLCTKFEKRHVDAKAGQTLACFSHKVLWRFGVPIRAFEQNLREQLSDKIYIHSGKQLDELNEWAIKYCKVNGTDSDYEAFDRSQDALILAFEIPLLEHLGWSQDLIDDYVEMKLNLGCRLGNLAIMRFTGEFGTFILNTCCNMLFTCLRYEINGLPIAFAGDDMFAPGFLKIRKDREFLLNRFSLKAKVNFSRKPMFCGWRMTRYGIIKEPKLVLERFKIARERGTFQECLINYCLEVSFAYRLGDRLYDLIENIEDLQLLVRIVVKNKHLLPKKIRSEFESFDHEFGGCEPVPEESDCLRVHSFGCGLECSV
ncbi:replicase [Ficus tepovirus A]|nr:replicase [Ficus tepovirus A]